MAARRRRRQEDEILNPPPRAATAIGGSGFPANIRKLSGPENYLSWKFNMKMMLLHEGLWGYVEGNVADHNPDLDGRALAKICLWVDEVAQVNLPADVATAKDAWDALNRAYEAKGLGRKMWLQRHIMNVRLSEFGTLREYIDDIMSTARQLNEIGAPLGDEYVGVIMLNNLGPKYESFIMAIENSGVEISSDLIRTRLLSHDVRMTTEVSSDATSALFTRGHVHGRNGQQNKRKDLTCYNCNEVGHIKPDCPRLNQSQNGRQNMGGNRPSNGRNHNNHNSNHGNANSNQGGSNSNRGGSNSNRGGSNSNQGGSNSNQGGTNQSNNNSRNRRAMLAIAKRPNVEASGSDRALAASICSSSKKFKMAVDSGCTGHMRKSDKGLRSFDSTPTQILIADDSSMQARGSGDLNVNVKGSPHTITDVLHVPDLAQDLLSVSKLASLGWRLVFDEKGCSFYRAEDFEVSGKREMRAECENGIYLLELEEESESPSVSVASGVPNPTVSQPNVSLITEAVPDRTLIAVTPQLNPGTGDQVDKDHDYRLWHRRLAHLGPSSMIQLRDGLVKGISFETVSDANCVPCLQGKMSRRPFPKKAKNLKVKGLLDLVHSDICGPMEVTSWGGARYFITFTDSFSRKTVVYTIARKDEGLDRFKQYMAMAENQTGKPIKRLRTDNGREYVNHEFSVFLQEHGIIHETSVVYEPQQHGLAERVNRTVNDKARCMLYDSGLDKRWWAEGVNCATYIKNRVPTRALKGAVPEEVWSGIEVDLSHLRDFGCVCYVYVPKQKRKKFDAKAEPYWMVGYSEETKGYRVAPQSNPGRVEIKDNVSFLESDLLRRCESQQIEDYQADEGQGESNHSHEEQVPARERFLTANPGDNEGESLLIPDDAPDESDNASQAGSINPDVNVRALPESRYPARNRKPTNFGDDMILYLATENHTALGDPVTVKDALSRSDSNSWKQAMQEEYDSLITNNAWKLVDRPTDKNVVKSKWVFKLKKSADGKTTKHKARLVAKGFSQRHGVDYFETFSPMVRHSTVRLLFALAAEKQLEAHHLDIRTAFLHGELKEEVYLEQPDGFIAEEEQGKVCLLLRALYGLKQASRVWFEKVDAALTEIGYAKSQYEPCLYSKRQGIKVTYIAVYVDDFFLFSNDEEEMQSVKCEIGKRFDMKDLGQVHDCLGMRVTRRDGFIKLDQEKYAEQVLQRFSMTDCNPARTPLELKPTHDDQTSMEFPGKYQEVVGSLMYLAVCTRVDLAYAVSFLSQSISNPTNSSWSNAKRVLRYLAGTTNHCLMFQKTGHSLVTYADADWGGCSVDRKSYSGFALIYAGGAVSWEARKQQSVALSSTEAEYMAISEAAKETIHLKGLLEELGENLPSVVMYNDNQSARYLAMDDSKHRRTKHIDVRYHFVRELCEKGVLDIQYMSTASMPADILTKPLGRVKHESCLSKLLGQQ